MVVLVEQNSESEFRGVWHIDASIVVEKVVSGFPSGVRGVIKMTGSKGIGR